MDVARRLLVVAAGVTLLAIAGSPCAADESPGQLLSMAHVQVVTHFTDFNRLMGTSEAADLDVRLRTDMYELSADERPDSFPVADWNRRLSSIAELDSSIVRQVLAGKSDPLPGTRGLAERLFVARGDGTLQPYAIYVPATLGADSALVILLHGQPQTESEILSWPYFQSLAERTGTIIVAPWGRGNYDFAQPAADEVYQVLDEVSAAFHIRPRRLYLAGYSMGGFSVFKVGPLHGNRWAAVMCISGAVLNSEADAVRRAFYDTPFYVVTGAHDDTIPAAYGELTAEYLASVGIPTEFDEEPTGTHYLASLVPALTKAWSDMLAGVLKNPPPQTADALSLQFRLPSGTGMKP